MSALCHVPDPNKGNQMAKHLDTRHMLGKHGLKPLEPLEHAEVRCPYAEDAEVQAMHKADGSLSQLKSVRSTQPWHVVMSDSRSRMPGPPANWRFRTRP